MAKKCAACEKAKMKKMANGGDPKTIFKPVAKSTEPKPKGYNDNLVPLNPSGPPTKKNDLKIKGASKVGSGTYKPDTTRYKKTGGAVKSKKK